MFSLVLLLVSYVVLGVAGKFLFGLIVGVLLMDFGTQACHVSNQTRIYGLAPDARSRLNMFYMVCYFAGGALGSILGAYAWKLYGWPGVCAFCSIVMVLMLLKFVFLGAVTPSAEHAALNDQSAMSEF